MTKKDREIITRRQEERDHRLDSSRQPETASPVLGGGSLRYEMTQRVTAITQGGIGLITQLVRHLGLAKKIDDRVHLLKKHQPYHESDHVLVLTYNIVAGGHCLDDLKALRNNVGFLDALGAERIPDATTAGDFLRRFDETSLLELMEACNEARTQIWRSQPKSSRKLALIDVDGTVVPTLGSQKEGADFSYKGKWGYGPLLVSLANSQEALYVVNRSASRPSHDGAVPWLDKAVEWARESGFQRVRLRGDTDFSLTANFDRWTKDKVEFVFGIDAHPSFVARAKAVPEGEWRRLRRKTRRPKPGLPVRQPGRDFREEKVEERGFRNYRLKAEYYLELPYQPCKSKKTYRMIVLRKHINVLEGQQHIEDEIRYFFYVTNVAKRRLSARKVIFESNVRCHQENLIEQLKNGVRATQMPSGSFTANWAYMVIGTIAWNLKIWLGLVLPNSSKSRDLLRMEYRRFVSEVITFATQIVSTGRTLVLRPLALNGWTEFLLEASSWFRRQRRRYV